MTAIIAYLQRGPVRGLLAVGLAAVLATPGLAAATFHDSNTLKLSFGVFSVFGNYTKQACSAQANLRSSRGRRVGFSIYWKPGRALYLITTHPDAASASGAQQIQFRFPGGKAMAFAMSRSGPKLQTNIGFGAKARKFYDALSTSASVRIELPGVGDTVDLDLSARRQLEGGMRYCKKWLR